MKTSLSGQNYLHNMSFITVNHNVKITWADFENPAVFESLYGKKIPYKKSDFISFLHEFSFSVPDLKTRLTLLDRWNGADIGESCRSLFTAIVFSTAQVDEMFHLQSNLSESILLCFKRKTKDCMLDFILACDWGKFYRLEENVQGQLLSLMVSNKSYLQSDELCVFLLKALTQADSRSSIKELMSPKAFEDFFYALISKSKGRSGGLIKQNAFLLRREKLADKSAPELSADKLYDFICDLNCDQATMFSIVSIASRIFHVALSKILSSFRFNYPEAYSSCLYALTGPNLIWVEIQKQCVELGVVEYQHTAVREDTLNGFYKALSQTTPLLNYTHGNDKVGVIITTYNANVDKLEYAVRSVLAQSYKNIRLIIVDDCSSDACYQRLVHLLSLIDDERVSLISNESNIGQYVSRNIAIDNNKDCKYFAIQDDDDFSHPDRIAEQLALLKGLESLKLVMCYQARFTEDMLYVADRHQPDMFDKSPATSMFSRDTHLAVGGFSDVRTRGDTEYIQRIKHLFGNDSVDSVKAPLYIMRCDVSTVSASKDKTLKSQLDVFRLEMGRPSQGEVSVKKPWALAK